MKPLMANDWTLVPVKPYFTEAPAPRPDVIDLSSQSPDWLAGWAARAAHIPPLSTWRGLCGHLWDRAVEDTDVCPRCGGR